ncbi:MAG: ribosome silencing factor, partial [Ramlibacter sp.]
LFERVIIATGASNRQTKSLAASVRDAVREAGFPKPRIEGEENGEWIIVDCGAAVAHVMQPAIRTYYHLEEIWGDKPVRLKFGAPKPAVAEEPEPVAGKPARKKGTAEGPSIRRASAAKTAVKAAEQAAREARAKPAARKPAAKKSASRSAPGRSFAGKTTVTKVQVGKPAPRKPAAGKPAAKKTTSRAPSRKA